MPEPLRHRNHSLRPQGSETHHNLIFQCVKAGLLLIIFVFGVIHALNKQVSGRTAGRSEGSLAGGAIEDTILLYVFRSVIRRSANGMLPVVSHLLPSTQVWFSTASD